MHVYGASKRCLSLPQWQRRHMCWTFLWAQLEHNDIFTKYFVQIFKHFSVVAYPNNATTAHEQVLA